MKVNPHVGLIPNCSYPSQAIFRPLLNNGLEIANRMTRILLTWPVHAALHVVSSSTKTCVRTTSAGELDPKSKNNLTGITLILMKSIAE